MDHVRIRRVLKCIAFLLLVAAFAAGATNARSTSTPQDQSVRFEKWGISFDYPKAWKEYGADRAAMMKEALAAQLKPFAIEIKEFGMIVAPNEALALLITKSTRSNPFKVSEIVAERNQVYQDAKKAGDVTRINYVKEDKIAGWPAVAEDVERSNGGRGRTYKMIMGKTIVEISFVVSSAQNFTKYEPAMDRVLATLAVADK
jgi:hypothetical protein